MWVVSDATINGTETCTSFKQALQFVECGFNLHDTMIFQKTNPIPQIYRKRYTNVFEYMFVFSKGAVKTHNPIKIPCEHAGLELKGTTYKNYSKGVQTRSKLANPVKNEKQKGNIWEYVVGKKAVDQEAKGHPAPFPYQLAYDHIFSWTNEGDIVLEVSGDSMLPWYPAHTRLLCRPCRPHIGDRVIAVLKDGEVIFKIYVEGKRKFGFKNLCRNSSVGRATLS